MAKTLSNDTLGQIGSGVATPAYDRHAVSTGIVHLGVGAFHRAHQAAYVDRCLADGQSGWGILGASLQSAATRDALGPQDGLYTLSMREGEREELRVIGALQSVLVAPENPAALIDAMADPGVRIVTLTVTEKAYLRDAAGGLDQAHPDIVWDRENPHSPRTIYGFLTAAVERRRAAKTRPFTVLSCDNLPANGATLRRLLLAFAALGNDDLGAYIETEVRCPSSMVDRIVPATTDSDRDAISAQLGLRDAWPVVTEPYSQWVIEDDFPAGRPDWERFGVTMVRDVRPFENMKLRLLNGAHSSIAYLGLLSGHATVAEAFADPAIRSFVTRLWAEATPTLPGDAGLDPQAYVAELTRRFDNPSLKHRTAQIGNDGSQKLPQRIVATALDSLRQGGRATHLMLTIAAWIAACEARHGVTFTDPLDLKLAEILAGRPPARDAVERVFAAAGFASGQPEQGRLIELAAAHLASLREHRVAPTLSSFGAAQ